MSGRDRSNLVLVVGWWLSLAVHLGLGLGVVRYGAPGARLDEPDPSVPKPSELPPPAPQPPPTVRLGVADSEAQTLTWLAYEAPVEHEAPKSRVEQPALTIAAPGPQRPSAPPQSQPPTVSQALKDRARDTAASAAELLATARQRLDDLAAELERLEEARQLAAAAPKHAVSEATPPAAPPSEGGGGGLPGHASNKESPPTSIRDATRVHPGRVVSAQGLEIRTIAPRWSTTTRMTVRPRNPTMRITFRRDGTVKEAEFVREGTTVHDAGSMEINQPLLAAVYAWTAKGKPLDQLDAKDPDAGVTIMMTILLSG